MTSVVSELSHPFITNLTLVQGSATQDIGEGGDYEFDTEEVHFYSGSRRQVVSFVLNPDLIVEGTEDFMIRATRSEDGPPYNCIPPCIPLTTIFILDNDRKHFTYNVQ